MGWLYVYGEESDIINPVLAPLVSAIVFSALLYLKPKLLEKNLIILPSMLRTSLTVPFDVRALELNVTFQSICVGKTIVLPLLVCWILRTMAC